MKTESASKPRTPRAAARRAIRVPDLAMLARTLRNQPRPGGAGLVAERAERGERGLPERLRSVVGVEQVDRPAADGDRHHSRLADLAPPERSQDRRVEPRARRRAEEDLAA